MLQKTDSGSTLKINTPRWAIPVVDGAARYKGAHGGRGCVHPDTLIDTPNGQVRIKDFRGGQVYSWLDGRLVIAEATKPVEYDEQDLYEVILADGSSIIATDEHKFLTQRGWVQLQHLSKSDEVVTWPSAMHPYPHHSSSGIGQQESREDARHSIQIPEGSQADYSACPRRCDRSLQSEEGIDQVSLPSLADEQLHNCHVWMHEDAPACVNTNSLSRSLLLPSSLGAPLSMAAQSCEALGSHSDGISFVQLSEICQEPQLSHANTSHCVPSLHIDGLPQAFGIWKVLVGTRKKAQGTARDADLDDSLGFSCGGRGFKLSSIRLVRNHSHQRYWDLHVYGTNCYLSNGIVNHNSGKSHLFAEHLIELCSIQKTDAVCVREIQKSLNQSVKKLLENKIVDLGVQHLFEVQRDQILSAHGGRIIFQGMQNHTAESIKSLEGYDIAWVEEAQTLSQHSLDLLRPTIRKPGSELWFTWNPRNATDPVDALLRSDDPPPNAVIIPVNYEDNPWFPDVLRDEMEYDKKRDPEKFQHIWRGEYLKNSEARVFKNWKVEEFEAPADAVHRLGADWGFSTDPTILTRCHIIGRKLYIDYEAYKVGCEIIDTPALFATIPDSEKWPIVADNARPETISHMRKNGYPKIMPAIKGAKSVEEGVAWLQSFDIIVHPRCIHAIDELTLYSYKVDALTNMVMPILNDKDNHVIDALRYACEGARRAANAYKPTDFAPLPSTNHYGRK
jgi:phage terminase large subunit